MGLNHFITEYNINEDFWKDNKELLSLGLYRDLYERDTSEGKKDSAEVLRVIYFVYDHYCIYHGLPREVRIDLVEKEFLKKTGAYRSKENGLKPYVELYETLQKDSPRRILDEYQELIDAKLKFMRNARQSNSLSIDDWTHLDKMSLTFSKMIEEYKKLEASVEESEAIKRQGGVEPGLLASGDLHINRVDKYDLPGAVKPK